eukprot:m.96460 g.96460  ORF g.96460 m.96460 type:complete len:324 (-) comp15492_c0_seq2:47-1018(-)
MGVTPNTTEDVVDGNTTGTNKNQDSGAESRVIIYTVHNEVSDCDSHAQHNSREPVNEGRKTDAPFGRKKSVWKKEPERETAKPDMVSSLLEVVGREVEGALKGVEVLGHRGAGGVCHAQEVGLACGGEELVKEAGADLWGVVRGLAVGDVVAVRQAHVRVLIEDAEGHHDVLAGAALRLVEAPRQLLGGGVVRGQVEGGHLLACGERLLRRAPARAGRVGLCGARSLLGHLAGGRRLALGGGAVVGDDDDIVAGVRVQAAAEAGGGVAAVAVHGAAVAVLAAAVAVAVAVAEAERALADEAGVGRHVVEGEGGGAGARGVEEV